MLLTIGNWGWRLVRWVRTEVDILNRFTLVSLYPSVNNCSNYSTQALKD